MAGTGKQEGKGDVGFELRLRMLLSLLLLIPATTGVRNFLNGKLLL